MNLLPTEEEFQRFEEAKAALKQSVLNAFEPYLIRVIELLDRVLRKVWN